MTVLTVLIEIINNNIDPQQQFYRIALLNNAINPSYNSISSKNTKTVFEAQWRIFNDKAEYDKL